MPDKIKSPIQLMAAWFVMLVSVITVLLTTAVKIDKPEWAAGYLVISATIVILFVIACVFLMLTMFRPHLQDAKEYAEWIKEQGKYSEGKIVQLKRSRAKDSFENEVQSVVQTSDIKNISVSVIDIFGSSEIIGALRNKGFNVDLHPHRHEEYDTREPLRSIQGEQEGIWIGCRVEADIAIRAIKIALGVWPDLKYVVISSDNSNPPDYVNDQIFIGGSSQTAIEQGTNPWSIEELKSLNEDISINEFHRLIRAKYS